MITDTFLQTISKMYDLKALSYNDKVAKGFLSENHILTDGEQKYFLKQYRYTDPEKIRFIHDVGEYFSKKEIPVICPLHTKTGEDYFSYEDRFYTLFPFVDAFQYEYANGTLTEKMIISMGQTLAKIHRAGSDAPFPKDIAYNEKGKMLELAPTILEIIQQKSEKDVFDMMAQETLNLKLSLIAKYTSCSSDILSNDYLVHGDYTDHNVFFDEQGHVSSVFDFEKAVYQHRSQELFRSLYLIFIEGNDEYQEMKDAKKYLDAYLSMYPMSYEELSAGFDTHYQKMIYGIWVESEHYLKENSKIDSLLKRDHVRLHFIAKNNDMFKEFLFRDLSRG